MVQDSTLLCIFAFDLENGIIVSCGLAIGGDLICDGEGPSVFHCVPICSRQIIVRFLQVLLGQFPIRTKEIFVLDEDLHTLLLAQGFEDIDVGQVGDASVYVVMLFDEFEELLFPALEEDADFGIDAFQYTLVSLISVNEPIEFFLLVVAVVKGLGP